MSSRHRLSLRQQARRLQERRGLGRRAFLRGVLGGTAVAVGLPFLELFADRPGQLARAAADGFPGRFVLWFWGNGMLPDYWIPGATGPDWELTPELAPLASVKADVSVLTGFEVKVPNDDAHASGPAGFLSGHPLLKSGSDHTFAGPSLDQVLAAAIGSETLYRSVEIGVQPGLGGLSHNGPSSKNPPESDPAMVFERLFGPTFTAPGEEPIIDPKLGLRRSVLDAVMTDAARLELRLGAADKVRLEQHMSAVRDLEKRIARLEEDPPSLAACDRPDVPPVLPDLDGRPQMDARARVQADLSAMALACDLTRVLSIWYSDPVADVLYEGKTAGHHQLTHDEPGEQPQVDAIVTEMVSDYAYLVEALRSVDEGEGTLLDHSVVLGTSDLSYGRTHQIDEYPLLLAGRGCGALKTGFHYRSDTQENASQVPLSILRALGVPAASYGSETAYTEDGLSAIES